MVGILNQLGALFVMESGQFWGSMLELLCFNGNIILSSYMLYALFTFCVITQCNTVE